MWPTPDNVVVLTSWTNGHKAVVHLVQDNAGSEMIVKIYRPGFLLPMFREYAAATYAARRLSVVPRVVAFRPLRRELYFSYVRGARVLEWVLARFGHQVNLTEFQSFHGLDLHPQVADAFTRFRRSTSDESLRLKAAIATSYASLHRIGMLHGSADPRNIIYDERRVFIIDFDHARPCFNAAKVEAASLSYWYGLPSQLLLGMNTR
jgi:serine/threonine protein kinase